LGAETILATRSWTEPQRKSSERIGKQSEHEAIVDRDALDADQFKELGRRDVTSSMIDSHKVTESTKEWSDATINELCD
jgi:hypothetical protein